MPAIDDAILQMGRERYREASGLNDMDRDSDGFILLKPTASHTDHKTAALTADISSLEAKLQKYKEEKQRVIQYQKSDDYKSSKKEQSKKKMKKKKESLLNMVFNNADHMFDEDDDEEDDSEENEGYKDSRKAKARAKKANATTLDTTYGKRFAPVVSMLQDTIFEFDKIAADIEADLNSSRNNAKTMYRSSQIGNMISAKNSKLSAVKELGSIAKVISDLEYKKEKDKKETEGSDSSKAVANMAAKILRGGIEDFDTSNGGKKGKKGKKSGKASKSLTSVRGISRSMLDEEDDEDSPYGKIERRSSSGNENEQRALANEFAKTLMENKDKIKLTAWERNVRLEGTYNVQVLCDPLDPINDWKFVAVSTKNGKILSGDEYKEILPKKKKARMRFDLNKARATDQNSNRTYKLMFKD